jgi:hypothetical protein
MKNFLLPLAAAGGASDPYAGLNTLGLAAASAALSAGAAAVGSMGPFGGRSRPALRPQPPSTSTAALKRMMAHPEAFGLYLRFTTKSPMRAAPYKDCPVLARAGPS